MAEKKFELIPNLDSVGQRMVQVIPRNPKESAPDIDVDDLILDFLDGGVERLEKTGWLNGKYVKVTISKDLNTVVEVEEI